MNQCEPEAGSWEVRNTTAGGRSVGCTAVAHQPGALANSSISSVTDTGDADHVVIPAYQSQGRLIKKIENDTKLTRKQRSFNCSTNTDDLFFTSSFPIWMSFSFCCSD